MTISPSEGLPMTDPAAFQATFHGARTVASRRVAQLILEVPIEQLGHVLQVVGQIDPGKTTWLAVARLENAPDKQTKPERREKKSWEDLSAAQQAGILCADPSFQKFLEEWCPYSWGIATGETREERAIQVIYGLCEVTSRRDIRDDDPIWDELVASYRTWMKQAEVLP